MLRLPAFAVAMLRRREPASGGRGPVFPDSRGGRHDPSNTSRDLRNARGSAEFAWVTSHVFRKTAATELDRTGLTARRSVRRADKPCAATSLRCCRAVEARGGGRAGQ
jgi:integrase